MAVGVKRRGDKWDAWIKVNGRVHWGRGFDSQRAAIEWRDERVGDRKENIQLLPLRMTVEAFVRRYFELYGNTVKVSTLDKDIERFERYIVPDPIAKRPARAVRKAEVQAFVNRIERAYTTATAEKTYAVLRKVYLKAVEDEELVKAPTRKIVFRERSVELDVPTLEETDALVAAVREPFRDAVLFASLTGMRRGEIVALRWTAVNFRQGFLSVRRTAGWVKRELLSAKDAPPGDSKRVLVEWEPKTEAGDRKLVLLRDTAALLRSIRNEQRERKRELGAAYDNAGGYVFTRPDGRQLDPNELSRSVTDAARKLRRKYRFHDLRHSFVTRCVEAGIPAPVVAKMVGHTDAGFTQRTYFDSNPEQQRAAGERLSEYLERERVSSGLHARHERAAGDGARIGAVEVLEDEYEPV